MRSNKQTRRPAPKAAKKVAKPVVDVKALLKSVKASVTKARADFDAWVETREALASDKANEALPSTFEKELMLPIDAMVATRALASDAGEGFPAHLIPEECAVWRRTSIELPEIIFVAPVEEVVEEVVEAVTEAREAAAEVVEEVAVRAPRRRRGRRS